MIVEINTNHDYLMNIVLPHTNVAFYTYLFHPNRRISLMPLPVMNDNEAL